MKASDYIASRLQDWGITHVFELSGGMITHLLDSLEQHTNINIVTMHHEQSAAFAADAFGRVKGIPGVALATSGPGATNLLTGIGSCYFDSSPAIFITGQVNTHEQKGSKNIRQLGFQETDIASMAAPITKAVWQITDAQQIPDVLEMAYKTATSGRPGPVLIDIPMNMQRTDINPVFTVYDTNQFDVIDDNLKNAITDVAEAMFNAQKPMVLVGRGIRTSQSTTMLQQIVATTNWPVVTSLLAVDALPYNHVNRVGFIGSYGNRWANIALGDCDCLLVLGSRLDIRQTGADTKFFENRIIFHVDCEADEINNRITGCKALPINLSEFLPFFSEIIKNYEWPSYTLWHQQIQALKHKWPSTQEVQVPDNAINPNIFIQRLSQKAKKLAKCYLADVGSHQMWTAQSLEISDNQLFLTSAGMGAMGFALPAAIGACFALDNKPVITIIGDGSMQLNIQELETIKRNKLPIKIIVLNNENLGMIRQFQDSYFNSRYQSTYWGYTAPNFEKVAEAYGIIAKTISNNNEVENGLLWLCDSETENAPQLLQVMIDPFTNTYPKIAFGKPLTDMEPFVKPIDMEGT